MAAIVYLDVDDEITSAAARIRTLADERIALVLPLGSRLATSRINFRLLAREAEARGKRIEIVTNDASARALAASAGLPTHLSVAAFEGGPAAPGAAREADGSDPGSAARTPPAGSDSPTIAMPAIQRPAERAAPVPQVGRRPQRPRGPIVAAALLLVALVGVGSTAAFLFLPSAEIVLVPATETIGPLELNVTAQASLTRPDPVNLLVPATRFTFDVEASETFPATGVKVTETAATGEVTFSSLNTGATNTIPSGSIVKTESGIEFRTAAQVELPPAQIGIVNNEFVVIPSTRKVGIEAVSPGESGNVAANTIVVVPEGENPLRTIVKNEAPTSGGVRTETPQVQQADVDAARRALDAALATAFDKQIAGATGIPARTTLFPETKSLGPSAPSVDPATLVGTEVAEFELRLTAQGAVLGVDPGPVETLADARIRTKVDDGFRLLEDSISIALGKPIVAGSVITFPVTVSAAEIREVDAGALLARVRGLGLPQARTVLGAYGEVRIAVWPDWVTTVPTTEGRVTLTVREPAVPAGSPAP
ncbi:MAG: hypothetical protein C0498_07245 [Anaerolinea sp.]|nr:hypothetical protein [Anaerolinea sp.]